MEPACSIARSSTKTTQTDSNSQTTSTCQEHTPPSKQPSVKKLLELGVKVRDFAYTDKPPPTRPVKGGLKIRFTRPVAITHGGTPYNPRPREQNHGLMTGLKRTPTEPDLKPGVHATPQPGGSPKIKCMKAQFDLLT